MVIINEKAPEFKASALVDGNEKQISLKDFKGKKIALYFYPKDMTPGCTTQACNLRDNYSDLKKQGIVILGISIDSINSHTNFIQKKELPFILVSDENKEIVNKYNVWIEKSMYGRKYMGTARKTFLIDENQKIVNIIEKPTVSDHAKEILDGFKL